jgi:acetoacetyl-CoA synthetase
MSTHQVASFSNTWKHPAPYLTRVDAFRRYINLKYDLNLNTYSDLHKWSVDEIESFCGEIWTFCGLVYSESPECVGHGINVMWPRPEWFPGARLNYTENILVKGRNATPDAIAVSSCREGGSNWRHLTWIQLWQQVESYAAALRRAGVGRGDRVASELNERLLEPPDELICQFHSYWDEFYRIAAGPPCFGSRWRHIFLDRPRYGT